MVRTIVADIRKKLNEDTTSSTLVVFVRLQEVFMFSRGINGFVNSYLSHFVKDN